VERSGVADCLEILRVCDFQGLFFMMLCSFGGEVLYTLTVLFFFCILLVMLLSEEMHNFTIKSDETFQNTFKFGARFLHD